MPVELPNGSPKEGLMRTHLPVLIATFTVFAVAACTAGSGGPTAVPRVANEVAIIEVTPATAHLVIGGMLTVSAVPKDRHGRLVLGEVVRWSTSDATIAAVSPLAQVTAVGEGTVTIRATVGDSRSATTGTTTLFVRRDPAPPGAESASVTLSPGDDIQAQVDSHPAGTSFVLKAGVYRRQSVVPKAGMSFVGEPGAILDGENATPYAFRHDVAHEAGNVRIQGLVIERYTPAVQYGAIRADGQAGGWVVEGCEVRYNATGGIRLGNRAKVLRNNVHHNGQMGVLGSGDSVLVEGNEIAYNNYQDTYDPYWEAGGAKFVRTRDLVVRGNRVHHNRGPGLWTDIDNIRTLYENNTVEDNTLSGIFHEISYAAIIRGNTARRNGARAQPGWVDGAGILVAASSDVEVYGNTVEHNANGIVAIHQDRGTGAYGPWVVRNLFVHDNVIAMAAGVTGIAKQGAVGDAVFSSLNNRFEQNTYRLGSNAHYFDWLGTRRTEAQWRSYGQDVTGSFSR